MSSQLIVAVGVAAITFGLLVQALVFVAIKSDPPAACKLYAVRDKLVRLVAQRQIERTDPYFTALYNNVNLILACSHVISGPVGWNIAKWQGKRLANDPKCARPLEQLPDSHLPDNLVPVVDELKEGLDYLVENHVGVNVQISSRRRVVRRLQKERAKRFLAMIPKNGKALAA